MASTYLAPRRADAMAKDLQQVSASLRETVGTAEGQAKLQGMLGLGY